VRTPDGARVLAVVSDADEAAATVAADIAGAAVRVRADGTATLYGAD
jgi:acetyl-CoA C-acetyltransferase